MGLPKRKKSMNTRVKEKRSTDDRLAQFGRDWSAKQYELVQKHNELAKQIQELNQKQNAISVLMGRSHQEIWQQVGGAMERQDLNIVAMAELLKELVAQNLVLEAEIALVKSAVGVAVNFNDQLSDDKLEELKVKAEETYKELMATAFGKAHMKIEKDRAVAIAAAEKAQAEQAAAAKAQAETGEQDRAEAELKAAAERDRGIQQVSSMGGPGAEIPEGADVFGG